MPGSQRHARTLARGLASALAASLAGCLSFVHPVAKPAPELAAPCQAAAKCGRDHVYVFLVHGLDPFDLANLRGVRDYVNALGFCKTYYGQLYHRWYFEHELHRIHREDPQARFVVIGFSYGANVARCLAQSARRADIPVELLVYLGGNTLENTPEDQPENVREIVNILAAGCIWNGAQMDRAQNYHVTDVFHFGSPTHPLTLEVLAREMAAVAGSVPPEEAPPPPPMPAADETVPPSRSGTGRAAVGHDEWDFLKPIAKLPAPAK
jgi:hypothetical protein